MKFELYDFQKKAENDLRMALRNGSNAPVLVMPTGSGKTIVFTHIAEQAAARGNRILILVHRKELLEQASGKLTDLGVRHGLIASNRVQTGEIVQVASVDTLIRRLPRTARPDLIICDEAHHLMQGNKWGKVVSYFNTKIIGVTATPTRYKGAGIGHTVGGFFDCMIYGPSTKELIQRGFLSPPVMYAPPNSLDLSGIKTSAGDYDKKELKFRVDKAKITGDAIEHYKNICPGTPSIAFCITIKHAEEVSEQFNAAGIPSAVIDGTMSNAMREQRIRNLSNGTIKVLASCEIVSEGTDIPVLATAILLRPTQSETVYLQQCGRALRIYPGKECSYIIDHVGNYYRFGRVTEVRNWTLEGRKKKKKISCLEEIIKVKQCQKCYFVYSSARNACPNCGTVNNMERTIDVIAGTLEQIQDEKIFRREQEQQEAERNRIVARKDQGMSKSLDDLRALAKRTGKKPGWAHHVWKSRQANKQKRLQNIAWECGA